VDFAFVAWAVVR